MNEPPNELKTPAWKEVDFEECWNCGSPPAAFSKMPDEWFYDGDLVKCDDCGEEGVMCADEENCHIIWENQ